MSRHYLDHASTSPARPGVADAMLSWLERTADPGRVHTEGRMVRAAIEDAREAVAALLGTRPRTIVFTSGATEAANAAVWAGATAHPGAPIACAAVEHSSVREASLRAGSVITLPVDTLGRIDIDAVRDAVAAGPALVHCQWGNHEVGTLQPVAETVALCRAAGVLVHVDAAQAVGRVPVDLGALDADLVSVSAHKFGGPPGVGALVVRRGLRVAPFIVGGEQERARRGGMENVPAIAGFGVAATDAGASLAAEERDARRRTEATLDAALAVPGVAAYGDTIGRLPHLVCLGVSGVEAEAVLLGLDQAGIAAHSGSACSSESLEPSPVLEAMGVDADRSLRLSVGWSTDDDDVAAFSREFPGVVARLRGLRGA
ncbi:MAG TPA: cysteine desulfurase family protein [Acidimicrobiia bacterium]|nr:cysteine desulfurase family protein [Acidimicrobiia bacterium]